MKEVKLRNRNDYEELANSMYTLEWENLLGKLCNMSKDKKIQYPGYCKVCEKEEFFELDFLYSNDKVPNYRERLVCPKCKLNNRQRFIVSKIRNELKSGDEKIYMYEQVTAVYEAINNISKDVVGSEYLGDGLECGMISKEGIRHEDAMNLSFENEKFNIIISNDVFEHVVDINKTLLEAYRVLKKGGKLIASIPFCANYDNTKRRAKIINGNICNLEMPIYHGNPMSEKGSLVFYDFGWDILEIMKECGFSDAYAVAYYSVENGNIGEIPLYFEAIK